MRKLLFIALLFLAGNISAQELWPTNNTEWYYTAEDHMTNYGYSHYKIERDTVISGKTCQIYSKEFKNKFTGLPIDQVTTSFIDVFYIINLEDSVLSLYNADRIAFDTIVDFKATIGDSWRTYFTKDDCKPQSGELFFKTKVLKKEVEEVNGIDLLKFTLIRIAPTNDTVTTVFYQLIGGSNENFVFNRICYALDQSEETALRCFIYHSGETYEFNYKNSPLDCESMSGLATTDLDNAFNNVIITNPVIDHIIKIKGLDFNQLSEIKVFDNLGQEIKISTQKNQDEYLISIENELSTGIYYCSIMYKNGSKIVGKIIVQN